MLLHQPALSSLNPQETIIWIITNKKPNISYFWVFGSKYFILVKRDRNSKFAPKSVEGFLLGYDSNTKAYWVFNKSIGLVEVSCDIVFDETNGSQVEQVDLNELDDEEALCIALRNMSIGDVCLQEPKEPSQAQDKPSSSYTHLHQLKMRNRLNKKKKIKFKTMSLLMKKASIKGKIKLIKKRRMNKRFKIKDHLTQESTKQFNEITPSTL
jgi:hypothetical protein